MTSATKCGAARVTAVTPGHRQKGLDRHLVIETSAGLWHRQETSGSGSTAESVGTAFSTSGRGRRAGP